MKIKECQARVYFLYGRYCCYISKLWLEISWSFKSSYLMKLPLLILNFVLQHGWCEQDIWGCSRTEHDRRRLCLDCHWTSTRGKKRSLWNSWLAATTRNRWTQTYTWLLVSILFILMHLEIEKMVQKGNSWIMLNKQETVLLCWCIIKRLLIIVLLANA